jgi:hypothetical protein
MGEGDQHYSKSPPAAPPAPHPHPTLSWTKSRTCLRAPIQAGIAWCVRACVCGGGGSKFCAGKGGVASTLLPSAVLPYLTLPQLRSVSGLASRAFPPCRAWVSSSSPWQETCTEWGIIVPPPDVSPTLSAFFSLSLSLLKNPL